MAARAGVAVGGFYGHFRSKRQLLLVLMDRLVTELASLHLDLDGPAPGHERAAIARLVDAGMRVHRAYAVAYRAWREASLRDPELGALNDRLEAWSEARLAEMLRRVAEAPRARSDVDVETTAGLLNLLFWRLIDTPPDRFDATADAVTDLVYHAILRDD